MIQQQYKFVNPPLPYPYNSLEPFIDEKTMHLHHDRHLQTYVDKLNDIIKDYPSLQNWTLEQLLYYNSLLPSEIQTDVKNNAGGVYNHIFYFSNLINSNVKQPQNELKYKINEDFGSFQNFKNAFTQAALSVFGSGYAWLVLNAEGILEIVTTSNQNTPLPYNLWPVLNIDVWEHAYYLKNYNDRKSYVNNWFNVVNWQNANNNLLSVYV